MDQRMLLLNIPDYIYIYVNIFSGSDIVIH